MSYVKAFEFEVDPKWIMLRFTDGTMLTLDRVAIEREFTNPYELGALDVFARLDPLSYITKALDGTLREYLRTPLF